MKNLISVLPLISAIIGRFAPEVLSDFDTRPQRAASLYTKTPSGKLSGILLVFVWPSVASIPEISTSTKGTDGSKSTENLYTGAGCKRHVVCA